MRRFVLALAVLLTGCGDAVSGGGPDGGDVADGAAGDGPPGSTDAPLVTIDARPGDGVACGLTMMCAVDEVCCLRTPANCQSPAQLCNMGVIGCDGPEDCPGQLCCGTPMGSSCMDSCGATTAEMCHDAATCTTGDSCCQFGGGPAMDPYQHCSSGPCPL